MFLPGPQSRIPVADLGRGVSACARFISVLSIRGVWGSLVRGLVIIWGPEVCLGNDPLVYRVHGERGVLLRRRFA